MKRRLSLLLSLMCILLSAVPVSATGTDARKLYGEAMEYMNAAASYEVKGDLKLVSAPQTAYQREKQTDNYVLRSRQIKGGGGQLLLEVESVDPEERDYRASVRYQDGVLQVREENNNYTTKLGFAQVVGDKQFDLGLAEGSLRRAQVSTDEKSGATRISGKLHSEAVELMRGSLITPLHAQLLLGDGEEEGAIQYTAGDYTITLDKQGRPTGYKVVLTGYISQEPPSIAVTYTMNFKISGVNRIEQIDFGQP